MCSSGQLDCGGESPYFWLPSASRGYLQVGYFWEVTGHLLTVVPSSWAFVHAVYVGLGTWQNDFNVYIQSLCLDRIVYEVIFVC